MHFELCTRTHPRFLEENFESLEEKVQPQYLTLYTLTAIVLACKNFQAVTPKTAPVFNISKIPQIQGAPMKWQAASKDSS